MAENRMSKSDDDLKWETLSTEYISDHIYFKARRDRCLRKDGVVVDPYFVVELPVSATALAITENNEVIMVKQYRHPIGEVIMETPGGFIDEGEDGEAGMRRELLEETGYHFRSVEKIGRIAANPGVLSNYTDLFLASGGVKSGLQQLDHNEEIDTYLLPLEEVIKMLLANQVKQSLHANCLFYALIKMGKLKIS
ncbi:MAG: NUDIX hydrolase [Gemmatimonadaceae bacterium]|nr:NUDIX hydrolase [Chitinophagaceae bacterium]